MPSPHTFPVSCVHPHQLHLHWFTSSGPLSLAQEESKGWRQWSASWGLSSDVKEVLTPSETAGTSSDPIAETRLLARKLRTFQSGALLRGSVSGLQWVKPYSVLPAGWRCPYISFSVCTWYLERLVTGLHLSPRMHVLSYHFYFSIHFLMPGIHLTLHHDLLRRHRGEQVKTALAFRMLERAQGQIEPVLEY